METKIKDEKTKHIKINQNHKMNKKKKIYI